MKNIVDGRNRSKGNNLLVTMIFFTVFIIFSKTLKAEAFSYNEQAAINYAEANWNSSKGLCAEFVSDCIRAGGSNCWSRSCTSLINQLRQSHTGTLYEFPLNSDMSLSTAQCSGRLSPGDPVFFYCPRCINIDGKPYPHVVLYNGSKNGLMKAYSHHRNNNGRSVYRYQTTCPDCGAKMTKKAYVYHFNRSSSSVRNVLEVGGYYIFASALNQNMVLDVKDGSRDTGANIQLYQRNGSNAQIFQIIETGEDGWYALVNKGSGKVMDIYGGYTSDGTNVWQYDKWPNNSDSINAQRWAFQYAPEEYPFSDGWIMLMAKSGKFLDVSGGNSSNGTNIQIYRRNNTRSQIFRFIRVG